MADIVDKATRSRMMSGIRGKDTKPEMIVRRALHKAGYRYRLHVKDLPGKPDIVLPKYRTAIFVHGCFWHGHDCYLYRLPSTRSDFWRTKIGKNRERDAAAANALESKGWRTAIVWECSLKGKEKRDPVELIDQLTAWIRSGGIHIEFRGRNR